MKVSLLFYRKLRKDFEDYGFTVNPYNLCMANMMTKSGKQLMVVWHVEDLIVSCKENFELSKFLCYLAKIYGPKLSTHTRKKGNYLGVDMEFDNECTLDVSIITYLQNDIAGFPEIITGKAATSAADHLFDIIYENEMRVLEEEQALAFHHTVAQLLFLATRARKDTQTAVAFLTTRVKNPDKDNWGKLKRLLKYLNGTKYLNLIF
jgi:hypothetical protein